FKQGDMCEVSEITMGTHCGTHVDAPLHMLPDGAPLESIPLDCFVGKCRVLTVPYPIISEKTLEELQVKPGERILLRTDPNGKYNRHGKFNPAVLSMRAAQYLAQLPVKLVGIDAPTVENMELCDGEVHRTLLKAGIPLLEGLRLEEVEGKNYTLSALPIRLNGENGAPCRAVLIEED
ncbi:MAG: cyclase family protein, partial [Christensenellales bacterium]|nr:cyclase family protein [Christensenellales bacterium]